MTTSALKILGSLALLIAVLGSVRAVGDRFDLNPEMQRKLIHVGLGLYALTMPLIFVDASEVAILCSLAALALVLIRTIPSFRIVLGGGLHGVQRYSLGEIFFALSIGLLFYLSGNNLVLYLLPLMILTLCDTAAALVGASYGKFTYVVDEGRKSAEGTASFFLTAWLISIIALLVLSDVSRSGVILIGLIVAVFGALIEATSWKGLDNLFVPLGLFVLLERIVLFPPVELIVASVSFLALLATATWVGRKYQRNLHAIITAITVLFFIWIVSGWGNLVAPLTVFAFYLYAKIRDRGGLSRDDDLPMVLSIIGTVLFWYLVARIFNYSTAFAFNLAFGIHLVLLGLIHDRHRSLWVAAGFVFTAWIVASARILSVTELQSQGALLSVTALVILAATAVGVVSAPSAFVSYRWVKQAGLAIVGSGISLAVTELT